MLLPMLSIYQEYVRNHHYSLQVLTECKQSSLFVALLNRLENKTACHGRSLETFLTYPMHQVRLRGNRCNSCMWNTKDRQGFLNIPWYRFALLLLLREEIAINAPNAILISSCCSLCKKKTNSYARKKIEKWNDYLDETNTSLGMIDCMK